MEFSRKPQINKPRYSIAYIEPRYSIAYIEWSKVGISKIILFLSLKTKERLIAGCFAFLVFRDCCVALPCSAMGLAAVCDCGIS